MKCPRLLGMGQARTDPENKTKCGAKQVLENSLPLNCLLLSLRGGELPGRGDGTGLHRPGKRDVFWIKNQKKQTASYRLLWVF